MRRLSKTRVLAWRQCERRLWLELFRPDLCVPPPPGVLRRIEAGHAVGALARTLFDPEGRGVLVPTEAGDDGVARALARTHEAIAAGVPVFEAAFVSDRALAFVDLLLPAADGWRLVEVKSAGGVKDVFRDDVALQAHLVRSCGVPLASVEVATIDTAWTFPGAGRYDGLFATTDLTADAFARDIEVTGWLDAAHDVAARADEPSRRTGAHCTTPHACPFIDHCIAGEPVARHPVAWLPAVQRKDLRTFVARADVTEMAQVPDRLLNDHQRRVKACTLAGEPWHDAAGAAVALAAWPPPVSFCDFETIQFAVPVWPGTRPFQQLPFQFSLHRFDADGRLRQREFLDLSGDDPSERFALALIDACAGDGAIFVWNRAFEASRLSELARRFARLARLLTAIRDRLVDLQPIAKAHWYHPAQHGSASLKAVLPTLAPDLDHGALGEVHDGTGAQAAYLEAIDPDTAAERRDALDRALRAYCGLDTLGLARIWAALRGAPGKTREMGSDHNSPSDRRSSPGSSGKL